jgi:tetratricopeptide (TPR) repeat protein
MMVYSKPQRCPCLVGTGYICILLSFGPARTQADDSYPLRAFVAQLRQADVDSLSAAEIEDAIARVAGDLANEPDPRWRGTGALVLGDLHLQAGRTRKALTYYQQATMGVTDGAVRFTSLRGQRRAYERLGDMQAALRASRTLVEEMEESTFDTKTTGGTSLTLWELELRWLASQSEKRGDWPGAVEAYQKILDRYREPRLRWGFLREQARVYMQAGQTDAAYAAYSEAYQALLQIPNRPLNESFLSLEIELLKGPHRGVISRQYLGEFASIINRYKACGNCTLAAEYKLAAVTLLELSDPTVDEKISALEKLRSVIARAEAEPAALDQQRRRSAYLIAIQALATDTALCGDKEVLDWLSGFLASFGSEPEVRGFVKHTVVAMGARFADDVWPQYPELDELRLDAGSQTQSDDTPSTSAASEIMDQQVLVQLIHASKGAPNEHHVRFYPHSDEAVVGKRYRSPTGAFRDWERVLSGCGCGMPARSELQNPHEHRAASRPSNGRRRGSTAVSTLPAGSRREVMAMQPCAIVGSPSHSPDETQLAFYYAVGDGGDGFPKRGLAMVSKDGDFRVLMPAREALPIPLQSALDVPVGWSPDGAWIYFTMGMRKSASSPRTHMKVHKAGVHRIELGSGKVEFITAGEFAGISRDGSFILVDPPQSSILHGNPSRSFKLSLLTREKTLLPEGVRRPKLSPKGDLFATLEAGHACFYRLSDFECINRVPCSVGHPDDWVRDFRWILAAE